MIEVRTAFASSFKANPDNSISKFTPIAMATGQDVPMAVAPLLRYLLLLVEDFSA
jgi:hypothetical protein